MPRKKGGEKYVILCVMHPDHMADESVYAGLFMSFEKDGAVPFNSMSEAYDKVRDLQRDDKKSLFIPMPVSQLAQCTALAVAAALNVERSSC